MQDVTRQLNADAVSAAELLPIVYEQLRRLAASRLAGEQQEFTLQPTALVHEAWLKLAGAGESRWNDRQHFFATAAEAMRRILVDRARRRHAIKRGAAVGSVSLDEIEIAAPAPDEELLAVHAALEKFSALDPQKAELVKLRYFVGLTIEEAAETMNLSTPTVNRWWAFSRAWLLAEMRQEPERDK